MKQKSFLIYRKLNSFSFFDYPIEWLGHYFIKIKCLNKIVFNPFLQIPSERRRKKLTLPKPNECRSIHGSAAYVLEITSLLGIALYHLRIDDKFMRFLLSFTIFGTQTHSKSSRDFDRISELFSSFLIVLLALIDDKFMRFLFSFTIFDFFILHHKQTQNQIVNLTEVRNFFRAFTDIKSKYSDYLWDLLSIDDVWIHELPHITNFQIFFLVFVD